MKLINQIIELADDSGHSVRRWNEKEQKWWYQPIDEPITEKVIARHLKRGENCAGIWLVKDSYSSFCVFDLDDHKEVMSLERMLEHANQIISSLHERGVPCVPFLSGGGHGVHIWVLFEKPKRVDTIHFWADKILVHASQSQDKYTRKAGGAMQSEVGSKSEVEVLPKGIGKQVVALPYGRNSHLLARNEDGELVISEEDLDGELVAYAGAKRGPKSSSNSVDRDAAFDAVTSKLDPSNYDDWYRFAMRLIASFGVEDEWARRRWEEWSDLWKYSDAKKWDQCRNTRISPITFWLDAKAAGYGGSNPYGKTDERKLTAISFLDDVRLLRDTVGTAYAELSPRNFVPVKSNDFRNAVALALHRDKGVIPDETSLKSVTILAEAQASETKSEQVWLRFGRFGDKRYLFLADDDCTVLEIDADGWRVKEDAPIAFRRGDCLPMPMPQSGDIQELCDFLNIDTDNLPFLLAWMVTAIYFPGGNCPIALLDGPAGSGKSSALRTIITTIDPKVGAQSGEPKSEDDLFAAAYNAGTVSGDNFSSMARISDPLCRLSTGGGIRKRMLYTDFDVVALDVKRPCLIAGIDPTFYASDLAERIIKIELRRPEEYINDMQFDAQLEEKRARFTGAILSLVVDCIKQAHKIEDGGSRFATFGRVGEVVAQKLGQETGWFTERTKARYAAISSEIADADAVYNFIVRLIASEMGQRLEMRASHILEAMQEALELSEMRVSREDMPRNARQMGSRINRAIPMLEQDHNIRLSRGAKGSFIFEWDDPDKISIKEMMAIINANRVF